MRTPPLFLKNKRKKAKIARIADREIHVKDGNCTLTLKHHPRMNLFMRCGYVRGYVAGGKIR